MNHERGSLRSEVDERSVRDRLRAVEDPALEEDIVRLGLVNGIEVTPDEVRISLALNAPCAPDEVLIGDRVRTQLSDLDREVTLYAWFYRSSESAPKFKNVLSVVSEGKDVTRTVLTATVAAELAGRGARIGIVDGNVDGASVSRLFGLPSEPDLSDGNDLVPPERDGVRVMSVEYFLRDAASKIVDDRLVDGILSRVISNVEWGPIDYLFVDRPTGPVGVTDVLPERAGFTGTVVVATPRATVSDGDIATEGPGDTPIVGVAEASGGFKRRGRTELPDLLGYGGGKELADAIDVPFLGSLPVSPWIERDGGDPPVDGGVDRSAAAVTTIADAIANRVGAIHRRSIAERTRACRPSRVGGSSCNGSDVGRS